MVVEKQCDYFMYFHKTSKYRIRYFVEFSTKKALTLYSLNEKHLIGALKWTKNHVWKMIRNQRRSKGKIKIENHELSGSLYTNHVFKKRTSTYISSVRQKYVNPLLQVYTPCSTTPILTLTKESVTLLYLSIYIEFSLGHSYRKVCSSLHCATVHLYQVIPICTIVY